MCTWVVEILVLFFTLWTYPKSQSKRYRIKISKNKWVIIIFTISELKKLKTYKTTMLEISVNFFHAIFKGIEKLVKEPESLPLPSSLFDDWAVSLIPYHLIWLKDALPEETFWNYGIQCPKVHWRHKRMDRISHLCWLLFEENLTCVPSENHTFSLNNNFYCLNSF